MRFLTRLVRSYREAALEYTYSEFVESREGWTKEDDERTSAFLYSPTGTKLRARLSNYAIRNAISATREATNISHHNGVARGIMLCVRALEDHISPSPLRSVGTSETEPPASVADNLALR